MKKKIMFSFLSVLFCLQVYAGVDVGGTVKNDAGQPLSGITVLVSGTTNGTVTDDAGR